MIKLTVEEENILAMMLDASAKSEMLEALEIAKENAEDAEIMNFIGQCMNKVISMNDEEFDGLIITAAEELPQ